MHRTPSTTRPRTLASIGAALALTIFLSWALAAFSDLTASTFQPVPRHGEFADFRVYVPRDWTPRTWLVHSGPGIREDLISECVWMGSTLGSSPDTAPNRTRQVVSVGWPLPAMQWTVYEQNQPPVPANQRWWERTPADFWSRGLPQWTTYRAYRNACERRFPLRPAPIGFAADVTLFALAIWWGTEWFTRVRTARRVKAGRCVVCGYDLAGLEKCPECGSPVPAPPPQNTPAATIRP